MNETTELIMKQLNSKKVHAETHELGGGDEIDALKLKNIENFVTKTGDFTGTWNGLTMTSVEPGLSSAFNVLKADVVTNTQGVAPAPLVGTTVTVGYTGPLPIEVYDGWLYGVDGTGLKRSNDYGTTWETVITLPGSGVLCIFWCADGEVIIASTTHIWKSSGWSTPSTATWSAKVIRTTPGPGIRRWGIDGDGTKFIATEYSGADRSESRYVWASLDQGNTWNVVLDKTTIDPTNSSHMHGVCYDKWADRFWLSHGHGVIMGVYYSDDDCATWTKLGGDFQPDAAPTTVTATNNGIVCGSDSGDAGLYGIARTIDPTEMEMRRLARWNVSTAGVTGFAARSFRDSSTGHVYVAFKSDYADVASVVMAGTALSGSTVWESPTDGLTSFEYNVVVSGKNIGVISRGGINEWIEGSTSDPAIGTFDAGNVLGGISTNSTSVAIGAKALTENLNETVIGVNATTTGADNGTSIGYGAIADTRAVAIGSGARAIDDDSVSIGYGAIADGVNVTAIGKGATTFTAATSATTIGNGSKSATAGTALGTNAKSGTSSAHTGTTALGYNTIADGVNTTVVGHSASTFASSTGGTAVGKDAKASFASVAIGSGAQGGTVTGAQSTVVVGYGASASGSEAVAIGREASAGTNQVAIGKGAVANHTNSVAIGRLTATTDLNQVNLGGRHIEITELASAPAAPALNGARLFSQDNGAGKTQLCVRFATGAVIVLGTEA